MHKQRRHSSSDRTFSKHVSTKHRRLNLLSDLRITICMEQSINQSPHFLYPIKEEDSVQWGFLLARMPNGLGLEAMRALWLASVACQSWVKVVWSERERGSFPGHLYDSWQPWNPETNPPHCSSSLESYVIIDHYCFPSCSEMETKKHTRSSLTCHHSVVYLLSEKAFGKELLMNLTGV